MSDKLVVWIGNWIAVEAEGLAAICALVAIIFFAGALVQSGLVSSRKESAD
jgi:hypothetical protein